MPSTLRLFLVGALTLGSVVHATPAASAPLPASFDPHQAAVDVARAIGDGDLRQLDHLIVVTDTQAADAVSAAGLAGYLDNAGRTGRTAVLLTSPTTLPTPTAQAITASGVAAEHIYVVGGTAAVAETVRDAIARAAGWNGTGASPVQRIAGVDRYATAAAVLDHVRSTHGTDLPESYRTVVVTNGEHLFDALSAGSLAYTHGHLVVLSPAHEAPPITIDALSSFAAHCALIVGGPSALSERVTEQVNAALEDSECHAQRLSGADRITTALAVADHTADIAGAPRTVLLTADAASGSATATAAMAIAASLSRGTRVILTTTPDQLRAEVQAWMQRHRPSRVDPLPGTSTELLSDAVLAEARALVLPTAPSVTNTPAPAPAPGPDPAPITTTGWPVTAGGTGADRVWDVVTLSDGSLLAVGEFADEVTFTQTTSGSAITLTSVGGSDIFVARVNSLGQWMWARSAGGAGRDTGTHASVRPDGSIAVSGSFRSSITFSDTVSGSAIGLTANHQAVFAAAITAEGKWLWATAATLSADGMTEAWIAARGDNSAFIAGFFNRSLSFAHTTSGSAITLTTQPDVVTPSSTNLFVAKITNQGVWEWARAVGAGGWDGAYGLAVTSDGSAVVAGGFQKTVTLDETTSGSAITLISDGGTDIFVGKIADNGVWDWAQRAGGVGENDSAHSVAIRADGTAIIAGSIMGSANFGTITLPHANTTDRRITVASISHDGEWLSASATLGVNGFATKVAAVTAGPDAGAAVLTGVFLHTITVDAALTVSGSAMSVTSAGGADVIVARISPNGKWEWIRSAGGSLEERGEGITLLTDGSAVIGAHFRSPAMFGEQQVTALPGVASPSTEIVLARISAAGTFG